MISIDDDQHVLEWKGTGTPTWLLRPERVQKVETIQGEQGKCVFTTYETMQGPLTGLVNWFNGEKLDKANQRMCEDMKRWIESRQS